MEDWEDVPIPSLVKNGLLKGGWDDEDVDEDGIKESWEDEDESVPEPAVAPPPKKTTKKKVVEPAEKNGKSVEVVKEVPLDPVAEKFRQQRLVEEADYKATAELFSKRGDDKSGDDKTLYNFIPKSEDDFIHYAELISKKLRSYEKSFHYIGLLKTVMRLSMTSLTAADAKDVSSSITAVSNEKLKAEKEANTGKKKTGAKKKQLHVEKADDDAVVDHYADADDYDFM